MDLHKIVLKINILNYVYSKYAIALNDEVEKDNYYDVRIIISVLEFVNFWWNRVKKSILFVISEASAFILDCSTTHPWAFSNGDKCCSAKTEFDSKSCSGTFQRCESSRCQTSADEKIPEGTQFEYWYPEFSNFC